MKIETDDVGGGDDPHRFAPLAVHEQTGRCGTLRVALSNFACCTSLE